MAVSINTLALLQILICADRHRSTQTNQSPCGWAIKGDVSKFRFDIRCTAKVLDQYRFCDGIICPACYFDRFLSLRMRKPDDHALRFQYRIAGDGRFNIAVVRFRIYPERDRAKVAPDIFQGDLSSVLHPFARYSGE